MDGGPGKSARQRRPVAALAVGAVVLLATGCGLGDRSELENRITSTPDRADHGSVAGRLLLEARFVEGPTGGGAIGAPAGSEGFELPEDGIVLGSDEVRFEMDLGSSRAALLRADDEAPYVYIDDLVLYGRRSGVPDDDARPWVRLDLDDLDEGGGELDPFGESVLQAITALHPAIITDLVAGTLTGSIDEREREAVAGVDTTRYDVNISIDKALGDSRDDRYPEDRREVVDELIEVLGVDGDLHPAQVWIDDDGLLRRFSVALTQRPANRVKFALVVTMDYETYGGAYTDELPTPQEVLTVDTVLRFIGVVGSPVTEEAA